MCYFHNQMGALDNSEKVTIQNFVEKMQQEYSADLMEEDLTKIINTKPSFDTIINELSEYLMQFSITEKYLILAGIDSFIEEVIKADGIVQPSEVELYNVWKQSKSFLVNPKE